MPEHAEIRIMSDFINVKSQDNKYKSLYRVEKGNTQTTLLKENFKLSADSYGKQLFLYLDDGEIVETIYVFMSLMGNWSSSETINWEQIKFCRLRFDDWSGQSLILHGGYMGPKFSIGKPFSGSKRGPDPVKDFDKFKKNLLDNLVTKKLDKKLGEVILNQSFFNGVGTYLASEIIGRCDLDPSSIFSQLDISSIDNLMEITKSCCQEAYDIGGGEIKNWKNPLKNSNIDNWLQFYGNKVDCHRQEFGTRKLWVKNKFSTV